MESLRKEIAAKRRELEEIQAVAGKDLLQQVKKLEGQLHKQQVEAARHHAASIEIIADFVGAVAGVAIRLGLLYRYDIRFQFNESEGRLSLKDFAGPSHYATRDFALINRATREPIKAGAQDAMKYACQVFARVSAEHRQEKDLPPVQELGEGIPF